MFRFITRVLSALRATVGRWRAGARYRIPAADMNRAAQVLRRLDEREVEDGRPAAREAIRRARGKR